MQKPPMPQSVRHPAVDNFLKNVLRSGLLDREQLEASLRAVKLEGQDNAETLANHLVKLGKLTRFQAFKLMQGAAVGLVLGPFQVLSPLGKGGMGCVYLARDSRSLQLVALKVLPPKRAREEENLRARFQREMGLSQLLNHPHLAKSYESGVNQGIYYIAMEFIPGKSLYKMVSDHGSLPVARAARLFAEVTEGLEYAHKQGLIHRDLKPSNILITPNDHAKVLDVGLAIIQGEIPADRTIVGGKGYVVGTMDYLSPEQAEDSINVDARADIYALGCTLYYVLTGKTPFPGGNALQKILRHYTEEPVSAVELNPDIPPAFNKVLRKMMAKKREERYQSAAAVRQDLLPWITGEPVLPMDEKDSVEYQKAVTELKIQEVSPEMLWADIVGSVRKPSSQRDEDEIELTPEPEELSPPPRRPLVAMPPVTRPPAALPPVASVPVAMAPVAMPPLATQPPTSPTPLPVAVPWQPEPETEGFFFRLNYVIPFAFAFLMLLATLFLFLGKGGSR